MTTAQLAPHNRRRFGRRRCNFEAAITAPGRPETACVLVNIGSGGALLRLRETVWLPYVLVLTVPDLGLRLPCEIRHQRGTSLGLQFVEPFDLAAIEPIRGPRELPYWMGSPKPTV